MKVEDTSREHAGRIRSIKPFGMKDKLGYLAGDLGNNMSFMLSSIF
ncbi:hypothetical protein [Atopococcus tabaci]|nr:hypothetical protein [Atopococcus tabaci]